MGNVFRKFRCGTLTHLLAIRHVENFIHRGNVVIMGRTKFCSSTDELLSYLVNTDSLREVGQSFNLPEACRRKGIAEDVGFFLAPIANLCIMILDSPGDSKHVQAVARKHFVDSVSMIQKLISSKSPSFGTFLYFIEWVQTNFCQWHSKGAVARIARIRRKRAEP